MKESFHFLSCHKSIISFAFMQLPNESEGNLKESPGKEVQVVLACGANIGRRCLGRKAM